MNFEQFKKACEKANAENRVIEGFITFTEDSFPKHYDKAARTYLVSSDNKAFRSGMISNSIFGSCLDGKDSNVKLSDYMYGEHAWKIETCGLVQYIATVAYERDISHLGFFALYNEAKNAMVEDFARAVDYSFDAIEEYLEDHDDADLDDWSAYADNCGSCSGNGDWKISRILLDDSGAYEDPYNCVC